jgi:hypothetical protein
MSFLCYEPFGCKQDKFTFYSVVGNPVATGQTNVATGKIQELM